MRLSISKFSDNHTVKTAHDELHELMTEHITNTDRMNAFWQHLSMESSNSDNKLSHRKEVIRCYGSAAEIFEEAIMPFLQKIIAQLVKKIKEQDSALHVQISESIGQLIHFVLGNCELEE